LKGDAERDRNRGISRSRWLCSKAFEGGKGGTYVHLCRSERGDFIANGGRAQFQKTITPHKKRKQTKIKRKTRTKIVGKPPHEKLCEGRLRGVASGGVRCGMREGKGKLRGRTKSRTRSWERSKERGGGGEGAGGNKGDNRFIIEGRQGDRDRGRGGDGWKMGEKTGGTKDAGRATRGGQSKKLGAGIVLGKKLSKFIISDRGKGRDRWGGRKLNNGHQDEG